MKTTVVNMKDCPEGWEDDPQYIYVGRTSATNPGEYGNPHGRICYRCNRDHDRYEAVRLHAETTRAQFTTDASYREKIEKLRGKFLVCFCKREKVSVPCHADVYVELLEGT
jgi:hypothetical protein